MANTRIGRTVSVAGSRRKATFSAWVKRTGLGESWIAKFGGNYSQGNFMQIGFNSADNCFIIGDIPSASNPRMESTRKFRDTNAWYHYVVAFDTTQSTASNRLKFYINGELITAYNTATYPTLNHDLGFNRTGTYNNAWLGGRGESSFEFNGIMSHVHWIDGTAYDASAFGSTDSTTGEWKINTSPSVTYGTNGYFILKDGNSLTDASGKGNNFSSLVGTLTKTEDCPSNVFATWNPLYKNNSTFSNGNTTSASGSSGEFNSASTLGMPSGKWYMEFKRVSGNYPMFGIVDDIALAEYSNANMGLGKTGTTKSIALRLNDGKTRVNNVATTQGGSISNGDIVGVAVDKTTNKIYFSKNGQWSNGSGAWDSTTFNASTGATDVSSILTGDTWFFACGTDTGEANNTFSANFGNGYFGTTAITTNSGNGYAGAEGASKFSYQPPSGHSELNTKGLNQ